MRSEVDSIIGLVDRIDSIERETEDIYLRLGKVFHSIMMAVDASASSAEQTIAAVLSQHRGGLSADAAKRRSDDYIDDATRYFKKTSDVERTFLDSVETGIRSLSALEEIIDRIRSDSEEMELVSLNAMTVALKSGAAGRAFSVITDELKRLSGRTIRHADNLSMAGSLLLERLDALKLTLDELSAAQASFFDAAKRALEDGFVALDREVDDSASDLRELAESASRVRSPIADIMQEVQLQDIIRQSLDHVRLSLKAARPEAGPARSATSVAAALASAAVGGPADDDISAGFFEDISPDEERAFLVEISRLSASLLDDVSSQVRASLERFRAGIAGVNAVVASVDSSRSAIVAGRRSIERDDFRDRTLAYMAAKEKAVLEASEISDSVRKLDERFKEMDAILARFKSIVTASRIETARNKALAIVANTVGGMMDLTERLAADVSSAGTVTRSFGKTFGAGMADYLFNASEGVETLKEEIASLEDEGKRIVESRQRLWETESEFKPFSDDFMLSIDEASGSVDRIDSLASELEGMRDAIVAQVAASVSEGDGPSAERPSSAEASIHSARLKSIVDRFTIFAHKQTAARVTRLDAGADESSAESGEVTLF